MIKSLYAKKKLWTKTMFGFEKNQFFGMSQSRIEIWGACRSGGELKKYGRFERKKKINSGSLD